MAHIKLPDGEPGISGLLVTYRETEQHINGLTQAAMRGAGGCRPRTSWQRLRVTRRRSS